MLWSLCGKDRFSGNFNDFWIAIPLDSVQIVSFDEPLLSQVASQEALVRLLVEKGIFIQ